MAFIPTPDQFSTWQEWANHVVEALANQDSSTAAPTISSPAPVQKILKAVPGSYTLLGRDADSYFGPHLYQLAALGASYDLSAPDIQLLLSSHPALAGAAGSYALTGEAATLTKTTSLPTQGSFVATFHSIGLYWQPVDQNGNAVVPLNKKVNIQYQRKGEGVWHRGHDMWYDDTYGLRIGRPKEARGSIFFCVPDTDYTVQFGLPQSDGSTQWVAQLTAHTWSENPPIGTTLTPFSGENKTFSTSNYQNNKGSRRQILLMNRSGTANGYTLYDFTGQNAVANAQQIDVNGKVFNNANDFCVVISGHHMILRGLKCLGGGIASIWIEPGSTDIWIEDCEITGFNRPWQDGGVHTFQILYPGTATTQDNTVYTYGVGEDAGISLQPHPSFGSALSSRIILQRNKVHNPLFGNFSWDVGHPASGCGVLMYPSGGNHVFRYNEFYSTQPNQDGSDSGFTGTPAWGQYWQDCIMGGNNFDDNGSPSPDTDVYKNIFMHAQDDAMEFEGGNMNVRAWSNYCDYCATGLASASIAVGPTYFVRNVINRLRDLYNSPWGTKGEYDNRLYAFKAPSDDITGDGRRYVYHNTTLQMDNPNAGDARLGPATGIANANTDNGTHGVTNTVSRNNMFDLIPEGPGVAIYEPGTSGPANDFDYDVTSVSMGAPESHGVANTRPTYQAGNGAQPLGVDGAGRYRLAIGSRGYDDGLVIDGINNDVPAPYQYLGAGPDRGAHEDGTSDMLFGVAAANSGA